MKNYYYIILLLFSVITQAQIVNITDANFKNALVNTNCVDTDGNGTVDDDVDTNDDGEIQISEALAVISLNVFNRGISSLIGIEYFENIEILACSQNKLVQLDLSQNTQLLTLNLRSNSLTSLNISQNINLEGLEVAHNNLQNIDVSQNINLKGIECSLNQLLSLDISKNPGLLGLACSHNSLNELDVSHNPLIGTLDIAHNNLLSIDLTQNINVDRLWVNSNYITELDLSNNPLIVRLHTNNNPLSIIDLSNQPNLNRFTCDGNQIFTLDLSQNPLLSTLSCVNNDMHNLNLKNGSNEFLNVMNATNNPNLTCIQVDDENATRPFCNSSGGWCVDNGVEFSEFCVLGVDELNISQSLIIHPNPVKDFLSLECQVGLEIQEVKIYNTIGKMIRKEKTNFKEMNVSTLQNGIYFLKIKISNLTFFRRIIKL